MDESSLRASNTIGRALASIGTVIVTRDLPSCMVRRGWLGLTMNEALRRPLYAATKSAGCPDTFGICNTRALPTDGRTRFVVGRSVTVADGRQLVGDWLAIGADQLPSGGEY